MLTVAEDKGEPQLRKSRIYVFEFNLDSSFWSPSIGIIPLLFILIITPFIFQWSRRFDQFTCILTKKFFRSSQR